MGRVSSATCVVSRSFFETSTLRSPLARCSVVEAGLVGPAVIDPPAVRGLARYRVACQELLFRIPPSVGRLSHLVKRPAKKTFFSVAPGLRRVVGICRILQSAWQDSLNPRAFFDAGRYS
jgi:hypothetical protein